MTTRPRLRGGFSLIELMVSLGILLIVTAYLTDMLTKQSRAYEVVDQVTEVQQNLRAIADLLERDMRVTGYMAPEAAAVCGVDAAALPDTVPDVLYLTDSLALSMPAAAKADYIRAGAITGGFTNTLGLDNIVLSSLVLDDTASYDISVPADGANESDFRAGAGVIIVDTMNPGRGAACGIIQAPIPFPGTTLPVQIVTTLGPFAPDEILVAVPANVYQIVNAGTPNPQLQRNGMLLADDVEDLQFALFYDDSTATPNGVIDAGEYPGSAGQAPYLSFARDNSLLREIRVNFVVRSRTPDREFGTPQQPAGEFQVTENRAAPAANLDQYRRRVHTMAVRPRNVGSRGVGG